jgi:hypothetical protein
LFGAILDRDIGPDTPEFVIRPFVGFLETTPPADVVDEDGAKVRLPALYSAKEVLKCVPALNPYAALAGIDEGTNDGDAVRFRESLDRGVLVLRGVLLVVR